MDMSAGFYQAPTRVAVAIPVHNEAETIEACLLALSRQSGAADFAVVALLNNCTDDTAKIARRLQPGLPFRLHLSEHWLDLSLAGAGVARRLAMQNAADLVGPEGVLLTTDADTRVPADWIARNLAHLEAGADAVAGMAEIDPADAAALPPHFVTDEDKRTAFANLLDEIDWLLDPDPNDAWPRHTEHSGASIAVRAQWHTRVGGIPTVALGEDRAFFDRLRKMDARIRHARDVSVVVSGRTQGRAAGGMAETIARRMVEQDSWLDDCFEPGPHRARRASMRAFLRQAWSRADWSGRADHLATELQVDVARVRDCMAAQHFGAGWHRLEQVSPLLARAPLATLELDRELAVAQRTVQNIRIVLGLTGSANRADTGVCVAAE